MASTPSNRMKLTPSNSPYIHRLSRSPIRSRSFLDASASSTSSRLSLRRVVGSTCSSPTGFDTAHSSFAYIAGGAVVVVDVHNNRYRQRFYRARPTAVPVYSVSPIPHAPSTPTSTPKANDSRNRAAPGSHRESAFGLDWADSPSGKTWTQRERIKSATCLSLSRDGRFLAVGETGYAPRVLIFNLDDTSSDTPLVSISEHSFGVAAVAWSPDSRFLASLGTANDGFLYVWKIDPRTGAAKLFQQNRCTSYVRGMIWLGPSTFVTFGVRHIKVWRVEEATAASGASPTKSKYPGDGGFSSASSQQFQNQPQQRTLPGRNILLGSLLDATFTSAALLADGRAIICSEAGDICLLETATKQMKMTRLRDIGLSISCVAARDEKVYIGSKSGQTIAFQLTDLTLDGDSRRCESTTTDSDTASSTTPSRSGNRSSAQSPSAGNGLVAMGFLSEHVVTIDARRSIDIYSSLEHVPGTEPASNVIHIPIPGHGEAILGVQALSNPNAADAAFFTWSASGNVLLWSLEGEIKSSFDIPIEQVVAENDLDLVNQLSVVRATKGGKLFIAADRLGVLRVMDFSTKKLIMETKAHSSDCQSISIHEDDKGLLLASSGRDRTTQLFYRPQTGSVEHFQTLEFAAKVVQVLLTPDEKVITCSFDRTLQVHDLLSKENEPQTIAAVPTRVITLKASPSSMTLAPDAKSVYVSLLDRTICQYDLATGKLTASFKCFDEGGADSALLDSLVYGKQSVSVGALAAPSGPPSTPGASGSHLSANPSGEATFLLGLSNTDKSVRIYDAQTGIFLDREWGHTEAINGVALICEEEEAAGSKKPDELGILEEAPGCRKVVSVGSDGTIMIWSLDLRDPVRPGSSHRREPSPVKDGNANSSVPSASSRPPLRRVLSKAELAEFQRTPTASGSGNGAGGNNNNSNACGRSSPARSLGRKSSRYNLSSSNGTAARAPVSVLLNSPTSTITEDTPSRRASAGSGAGSPPIPASPKARVQRRPSLPAMSTASGPTGGGVLGRKKSSINNLRNSYGFGSLTMATEQMCRQLRAYRKRLASTDPIAQDVLIELDQELRLTVAALGDRAIRSKVISDELDGLLDEKIERLVTLLDEKWRLQHQPKPASSPRRSPRHGRGGSGDSAASDGANGVDDQSSNSADTDNSQPEEDAEARERPGSAVPAVPELASTG